MSEKTPDLDALRKQAVKAITPQLAALSAVALADLLALEQNDANPRESLVAAIEEEQKARAEAAAQAPAAPPAWLAEDYTGPLTADQAQKRLRKHGHHITKLAPKGEAK